ncbi:MAG: hypothetical protein QNJ38_01620 [Prochloraceae cyanobacterium]|nr:hypothetical protein [Prochloraceae cyanobacterium]
MQSIGPSGSNSEHSQPSWAQLVGTAIAFMTLTLPLSIIAYYSLYSNVDYSPQNISTLLEK